MPAVIERLSTNTREAPAGRKTTSLAPGRSPTVGPASCSCIIWYIYLTPACLKCYINVQGMSSALSPATYGGAKRRHPRTRTRSHSRSAYRSRLRMGRRNRIRLPRTRTPLRQRSRIHNLNKARNAGDSHLGYRPRSSPSARAIIAPDNFVENLTLLTAAEGLLISMSSFCQALRARKNRCEGSGAGAPSARPNMCRHRKKVVAQAVHCSSAKSVSREPVRFATNHIASR